MFLCWLLNSDKILEIAQLLIAKGIDNNQTNKDGRNSADLLKLNHRVSQEKKEEILALLSATE